MPIRFDAAELRKPEKTREGFLRADAFLTRTGVFTYRDGKGKERRELRHPDEVFKADSLASLVGAPLTLDHPLEPVTAKNAKTLQIGSVLHPAEAGRFVQALVMVTDGEAVEAVEAGKNQLSCGYSCTLDWTPGEYNGERYDAKQTDILYNHVAALKAGRAGPEVAIRLDGEDAICLDSNRADDGDSKGKPMIKLTLDGVDFEVTEQAKQAVLRKIDAMQASQDASKADIAVAKADADKAKARADAAEAELVKAREASAPKAIQAAVAARVALEQTASAILGTAWKADGVDDDAIRKAVVAKVHPSAKLDGESDVYVKARFDAAVESFTQAAGKTGNTLADVRAAAGATVTNADAKGKADAAHERMKLRNQGKQTATA